MHSQGMIAFADHPSGGGSLEQIRHPLDVITVSSQNQMSVLRHDRACPDCVVALLNLISESQRNGQRLFARD